MTHTQLKDMICDYSGFLEDCHSTLRLEMVPLDPRAFSEFEQSLTDKTCDGFIHSIFTDFITEADFILSQKFITYFIVITLNQVSEYSYQLLIYRFFYYLHSMPIHLIKNP